MYDDHENARQLALRAFENDHDKLDAPESLAHYEAALKLARETTCELCDVIAEPIPAGGFRWVVQEHHEQHCPKYDDNALGLHHDAELRLPSTWGGDDSAA